MNGSGKYGHFLINLVAKSCGQWKKCFLNSTHCADLMPTAYRKKRFSQISGLQILPHCCMTVPPETSSGHAHGRGLRHSICSNGFPPRLFANRRHRFLSLFPAISIFRKKLNIEKPTGRSASGIPGDGAHRSGISPRDSNTDRRARDGCHPAKALRSPRSPDTGRNIHKFYQPLHRIRMDSWWNITMMNFDCQYCRNNSGHMENWLTHATNILRSVK